MKSSQWNLSKYAKMCRDNREGLEDDYEGVSDEMFSELAQYMLEEDEELANWMKANILKGIKDPDVRGCLADDIAYPGNCRRYVGKVK